MLLTLIFWILMGSFLLWIVLLNILFLVWTISKIKKLIWKPAVKKPE